MTPAVRSTAPDISIIIPTLNEEHYLPGLFRSITSQTYKGTLEIIVVDAHSKDQTVTIARGFSDKIPDISVLQSRPDIGHQRNLGAAKAKYDLLLFVDADVEFEPELFEKLMAKVPRQNDFLAATYHDARNKNWADRVFLCTIHALLYTARLIGKPVTAGDFIVTTKSNHQKIGGFAEKAILGEDTDYCLRSHAAGTVFKFYLRPKIFASPRRLRKVGRLKLLKVWSSSFVHVLRHGPIYKGQGYAYDYGDYYEIGKW